ncbi:DUF4185 domain-containing protein [Paenibacillus sp.]|uniref:DUF4185 domain-containing protein n=1 Tax=Paenibacillus sp. TaxID=58172 RepID=UPI002D687BE5|nr:DUF4185 domain-containing protein [Paenibacillus sp.]HZG58523.1 DUF4185 domain-containing protein [Paenibacillus sp.]
MSEREQVEERNDEAPAGPIVPEASTFFSTAYVEPKSTYHTPSNGDLWPVAWGPDDVMYTANGDGKGFDVLSEWADIVVSKFTGNPWERNITGERIASGDAVGRVWSDPEKYNKKPTGMISVNGELYLAVQDLNKETEGGRIFNDVPAATILKSTDKGVTWTGATDAPMFKDHTFTTIMFLDYGKDSANNTFDEYVYAYGMDYNWRDSFSNTVPDPQHLYLARMPKDAIQDAARWEYYTGDLKGKASWSAPGDIAARKPVLTDERRVYNERVMPGLTSLSVLSQGSIVYNKPLDRYLYTSWTEFTFEFYEAPTPWGPWKLFLSKDFGAYPWTLDRHGGYATVIPSRFISEDGTEMWLNSNTFVGGVENYNFSLRKLKVTPYRETKPENKKSDDNLARVGENATPISRAAENGDLFRIADGDRSLQESSFNGEIKEEDFWGFTWSRSYNLNKLVYTAGDTHEQLGGWFEDVRVQVRQKFEWKDVEKLTVSPAYPGDATSGPKKTYAFAFKDTWGDGVRLIGKPGGSETYTTITELEVYYAK